MCLPYRQLFLPYESALGGIREDFFIESMRMAGMTVRYLKSTRGAKTPDYLLENGGRKLIVEVGGRNKGREQFKGIADLSKGLILSHGNECGGLRLPLFLAGFL